MNTLDQTVEITSGNDCCLDHAQRRRYGQELALRNGDLVGIPAAGQQSTDLVPDLPPVDVGADVPRPHRRTRGRGCRRRPEAAGRSLDAA